MTFPALLPRLGSNAKTRRGRKKCSGWVKESASLRGSAPAGGEGFAPFAPACTLSVPLRRFAGKSPSAHDTATLRKEHGQAKSDPAERRNKGNLKLDESCISNQRLDDRKLDAPQREPTSNLRSSNL